MNAYLPHALHLLRSHFLPALLIISANACFSQNVDFGKSYFDINSPNDNYYGIANNTSTRSNYTTSNAWPKPDASAPSHHVFQLCDIIGDHTGAASPTLGNTAADTVANSNAGYMLIINAACRINSALILNNTNTLAPWIYILRVQSEGSVIQKEC